MLRSRVLDFGGSWEDHLHLIEFAYNNSYQASIGMALFEALYHRPCRSPLHWVDADKSTIVRRGTDAETGERILLGPNMITKTAERIARIKDRILAAVVTYEVGYMAFLKVAAHRGLQRSRKLGKLAPRFI